MMIMINYSLFLLVSLLHPFHVSVSSIRYASAEKSLQITMKIFADDLEEALNQKPYRKEGESYVDVLNPENSEAISHKVEQYIRQHFEIMVNGNRVEPAFLGYEIEDMAMWCYLEVKDIKKLKNIRIRNSVLIETFDDQVNIVHVNNYDDIKSLKLSGNQPAGEIEFE